MGRRLGVTAALVASAALLAGCAQQGVSTQGQDIHDLYVRIALLAAPVFVGVEAFLLWCVVRYRKRDDLPAPQGAGSGRIIGIFFAIPTVIIDAYAFQWELTFTYINEGLVETGKTLVKPAVMEVPVNQTVHIHLQSRDVMHEFYVPALLFMRNAIPGHPNDFDFTPTKLGTFPAQCAEYCGLWHSKMTFILKVVPPADYIAWIQSEKAAALNVSCPTGPAAVQLVAQNTAWNTN